MKISTKIVVFMLFISAGSNLAIASGLASNMGVTPQPGADQKLNDAVEAAGSIDPSGGLGGTLFAMYTSVTSTIQAVFYAVFAGPIMLTNLGVPSWIVGFLFAPANVLVGKDIAYALTGRSV